MNKEQVVEHLGTIEEMLPGECLSDLTLRLARSMAAVMGGFNSQELPLREEILLTFRMWLGHALAGKAFMKRSYEILREAKKDLAE